MSLSGIDFGNYKSVVAIVQNRSAIVIEDDQGKRETPSIISFVGKRRLIGVLGKSEKNRNLPNTIIHPKSLLALPFTHPEVSRLIPSTSPLRISKNSTGELCVVIDYKSQIDQENNDPEDLKLSTTQIGGIMLSHLKHVLELRTKKTEQQCVLAYPIHFPQRRRRCLKIAAEISGLKPIAIISESRAICLAYACGRTGLPKKTEKPRTVLFADFGHTHFTITIGNFNVDTIHIRSVSSDPMIGSGLIDDRLFAHVCGLINKKYKFNLLEITDPKPIAKLMDAVIKAKENLSMNQKSARINVDSLYNDIDVSVNVDGEDFQKLCEPVYEKIIMAILFALERASIGIDQIDFIEIVGGSSRIPSFKTKISDFFGKNVSTTLNATECIAQGCAYQGLLLFPNKENSPKFKIIDFNLYPISLTWQNLSENEIEKEMELKKEENENENENENVIQNNWIDQKIEINRNNSISLLKYGEISSLNGDIRFIKKEKNSPFQVQIQYTPKDISKTTIPELKHIGEIEQLIEKFTIIDIPKLNYQGEKGMMRAQFEIDRYGLVHIKSVWALNQPRIQKNVSSQNPPFTKLQLKKYSHGGYSDNEIAVLIWNEFEMNEENQKVIDRLEMKNELESYLYFVKNALNNEWKLFVQEKEKILIEKHLLNLEDWIYGEGFEVRKEKYQQKNEELVKLISPIKQRIYERLNRPKIIQQFLSKIDQTEKKFNNNSKNQENKKLLQICQIYRKWITSAMKRQNKLNVNQEPIIKVEGIKQQMNRFLKQLNSISNQK
ncbi:hypothetical protein M0813_09414 [Anaeramoeba flamelloides]|uniref:Hsc70cb isoform g-related n=1 Tax=Anaeramoeba flamelloides TaxID=1746091 RepID=A0AAV7Y8J0_9EUKA|nr:hsc70cb isoform g-related [Anaeramoeba flamelloides]KAJ6227999.1 hypothetical protein M0813_09414 [Anaeramoeba flamelloides]